MADTEVHLIPLAESPVNNVYVDVMGSGIFALREGQTYEEFEAEAEAARVRIEQRLSPGRDQPTQAEIDAGPVLTRVEEFEALPVTRDLVDKLRNATPAQIDTWLLNNVNTLAQARTVLGTMLKYLATRI